MRPVDDLIDEGDFCVLLIVILILVGVGQRMVQGKQSLQLSGLRISAVVFIVFTITRVARAGASSASELLSALMVGVAAGGLLLGPAWIVLAILEFLYENYRKLTSAARRRAQARKDERDRLRQQRQKQLQEQASQQRTPEQERAEREATAFRRREAERALSTAKRREEAIAACELLYHLRAPDLGERFTREQLTEFVKKFMGADKTIDVIERRAGELQRLIQQHYEAVSPPSRFTDLAELTAWYEQQRQQIGSLSVADVYKQDFLVQLNERYAELTQQTLEKL